MGKRSLTGIRRAMACNLRKLRRERNWTQTELADQAGIRQALVSEIELERANSTIESLDKIAAAFGVRIEDLFERGDG
jgi:transcriptional regulator with XRE-family HTH domain